ncbi:MAG: sigma-70 family RNA polymerase sigma factor [Cyanobacteria bacterium P01_F01_bin.4]
MNSRQSLIEIFAAFIEFQADRFSGWVIDAKLRRSMEDCLASSSVTVTSEAFWALYWYSVWIEQPESLAGQHLAAYLQETCYWSAIRATRVLANSSYRLSDCFQLASAESNKVLIGYNPNRGISLKGYASFAYPSLLRDILRQRQEVDICTDWTLLRRLSKKRMTVSLHHVGLSAAEIDRYQLAWRCYKTLCGTAESLRTRKMRKPGYTQWAAIATLYNTECQRLAEPGEPLTPETAEQWLTQCARWVRAYLYPPLTSLNVPSRGRESEELLDDLPDPLHKPPMAELIDQEMAQQRQGQRDQLNAIILTAMGQLAPETRLILQLYYQSKLTQQQIAQKVGARQYTISRRLTRARDALLQALVGWGQAALHTETNPDLIVTMGEFLEEWLMVHNGKFSALSDEGMES